MSKKIKLSISLLVSNTIDTIEKCMNSLQPILQNVPSELIIVDTGGTDGSIEIAKKYATNVVPFVWCNDFAKARNAGLSQAKGEWFLYLDDDEWFEDVEPIIEFFNTGEYLKYSSASYMIRNYTNKQGTSWEDIITYRMVKREKNTKFVSPIHEILSPLMEPAKRLNCFVHHYGYAYSSKEEAIKHTYRNLPLVINALEKNPDDYRLMLQLVKEYMVIEENEMAEKAGWNAVERIQKRKDYSFDNVRSLGWILINIIGLNVKKDLDKTLLYIEEFLTYRWINDITKNIIYYYAISICYKLKCYVKCMEYIPFYEKTFHKLMEHDDYRRIQGILELESMVTENRLATVYTKAICVAEMTGEPKTVNNYIDKLIQLSSYKKTEKELDIIFRLLLEEKDKNRRDKITVHLLKNEDTISNLYRLMDGNTFEDSMKEQVCNMITEVCDNDEKLLPYTIYAYCVNGKKDEIKKQLDWYISQEKNKLNIMHPLLKLIGQYKVDIPKYIDEMDIQIWTKYLNEFVLKVTEEKLETWIAIMDESAQRGFNSNMLYMRCIERKIRFNSISEMKYQDLQDLMKKYSAVVKAVYMNVYQETAFGNQFSIFLPKTCRFINKVKDIVQQKTNKIETAIIMKEAAEIYPEMAEFCKYYVIRMQEAEKEAKEDRQEFVKLGNMIKDKIRMFIYKGEYEAAKQTLNQLKIMLPNDSELLELEERLIN